MLAVLIGGLFTFLFGGMMLILFFGARGMRLDSRHRLVLRARIG